MVLEEQIPGNQEVASATRHTAGGWQVGYCTVVVAGSRERILALVVAPRQIRNLAEVCLPLLNAGNGREDRRLGWCKCGKVVGPPAWSPSKGMGSAEDWLDNGIEWSRIDKHSRGSCTSVDPPRWFSLNGVVLRSACQMPFTMQAVAHDA
jgi:hypothetical protein